MLSGSSLKVCGGVVGWGSLCVNQLPCNPTWVEVGLSCVEVELEVGLGCHNIILIKFSNTHLMVPYHATLKCPMFDY